MGVRPQAAGAGRPAWSEPLRRIVSRSNIRLRGKSPHGNAANIFRTSNPSVYLKGRAGEAVTKGGPAITLLHEIAHTTGPDLGRRASLDRRSPSYLREEVVAELTASRVARRLGIPAAERREAGSRAYIREHRKLLNQRQPLDPAGNDALARGIIADVRRAENHLLGLSGRTFKRGMRGRPVRGGGA